MPVVAASIQHVSKVAHSFSNIIRYHLQPQRGEEEGYFSANNTPQSPVQKYHTVVPNPQVTIVHNIIIMNTQGRARDNLQQVDNFHLSITFVSTNRTSVV